MNVRVAGEGDVTALAALRRAWNEEVSGPVDDADFEARFVEWLASEGASRTYFLVEVDGEPVSMANVKEYRRMPSVGRPTVSWGYVGNVFVLAEHRNAGVGAALMAALQAWSWAQGYDHLRLAPSPLSGRFYERLGYEAGHLVQLDP